MRNTMNYGRTLTAALLAALVVLTAGWAAAQKSFYDKEFKVGFKYPATMKPISTEASWAADNGFEKSWSGIAP